MFGLVVSWASYLQGDLSRGLWVTLVTTLVATASAVTWAEAALTGTINFSSALLFRIFVTECQSAASTWLLLRPTRGPESTALAAITPLEWHFGISGSQAPLPRSARICAARLASSTVSKAA